MAASQVYINHVSQNSDGIKIGAGGELKLMTNQGLNQGLLGGGANGVIRIGDYPDGTWVPGGPLPGLGDSGLTVPWKLVPQVPYEPYEPIVKTDASN